MGRNIYGLDLGTYEIKVYEKSTGESRTSKNVLAVQDGRYILAYGQEAYAMYEKAPENVQVLFPMENGVISRFEDMQYILADLLNPEQKLRRRQEYLVAVPTDVTEVEKKAFLDLFRNLSLRAREVRIVERGLAAGVGFGLDVQREPGILIADFGGDTLELSVLSQGGVVLNRMIRMGGRYLDQAVQDQVRRRLDFRIGRQTAEALRIWAGVQGRDSEVTTPAAGQNLITGIPCQMEISAGLVREAVGEPLAECARAIRGLLERTPPEVRSPILGRGIFLCGGLSAMKGLRDLLQKKVGLPILRSKDPAMVPLRGIQRILEDKALQTLAYAMLGEDYR